MLRIPGQPHNPPEKLPYEPPLAVKYPPQHHQGPFLMLKFYYHPSPNPAKVALFLEESGLPYEVVPVDTRKGEQFSREFTTINPNIKTPAIEDGGVRVFDR